MSDLESTHPLLLQPFEELGALRIIRRLATGGYGAIFLAETQTRGTVALKFALEGPSENDEARVDARTQREARLLMHLDHPNVVELLGYLRWPDLHRGYLYLIMDYVEGPTLSRWASSPQATPRRATEVFASLALTLDAIHRAGVVHRDLKGSNIIVRASDGQPVLVDFGSGDHACAPSLTEDRLPPGTPSYRSPEALRFWLGPRIPGSRYRFVPTDDLYSLGLVFHEVLTGVFPYRAHLPPSALLASIESAELKPPSVLNPRAPPVLDAIVLRLLSKYGAGRYPTGAELCGALSAALEQADSSWDEPLFPPRPPHEAVTEEDEALFDGDEEAREFRQWMRREDRAGAGSDSGPPGTPPTEPAAPTSVSWRSWLRRRMHVLSGALRPWRKRDD
ncbi:serine/threonine protein kinase [Myxococcus llanfairpwllgwyngyllgogerychwyrndrobwllllantysiliogogogochensis]|uniref:Serine/threonine protein kinase n=1 Tax=Myxococcus llanfairpwllgwyngyllgogerychwyrndrobwllllantysiliogogogochensis TaxID=2590453 RepID=A0A540WN41_9BACT|nr:serine/threonine-protein kinase [Myxococcus llanfairpwllgwyngyllgogerychwyrndrobwllllantysiliogogogochensis]TQF10425.1 serine/threonine protein kinase [Myxococcus llanfairpwllgwyngyllgogerychwyrndrobwllllantysiliogogogochensis]